MEYRAQYYRRQQRKRMLYLYAAFLAVLSVSVLLMPFGIKMADKSMILTYISGSMFWIGLLGTIAMAVHITLSRRRSKGFEQVYPNHKRLGLIHFFQNTEAFICDVLMFISLIGFIITRIWVGTTIWPFIFLSILIFSFGMHCMLNGSNYTYINYKIRRVIES